MAAPDATPAPSSRPANAREDEVVIVDEFARNHDPDDLIRYQGQWVAWSRDGRKVLFASTDADQLCEMIDAAGLESAEYVFGGIPPADCIPDFGWVALD